MNADERWDGLGGGRGMELEFELIDELVEVLFLFLLVMVVMLKEIVRVSWTSGMRIGDRGEW